ncbi:hypothetical protein FHW96_000287 [Novosphingobium sp. SG751A]|uniref:hypothetical protein n=1 Tax=Novosphingobium sp. SG751A TaxID=2587000 RepID=UPI0015557FA8|nr:hypothetical protein [Novosphingobium sp. SG751A]NOW44160.1 hypothetical protein [Novosphingobium sp. SG751A]
MATYRANGSPIYLCDEGRMVADGDLFTTKAIPGKFWEPQDDEAQAACKARFPENYTADEAPADEAKTGRKTS